MIIVTLTGYTCSGKSTLEAALKAKGFTSIMSTTTRKPRENEVHGVHYNFLSEGEFLTQLAKNNFVEHVTFDGYHYGVHKDQLPTDENARVVIVCEPVGAAQVRKFFKNTQHWVLPVYIDVPQEVALLRLLKRTEMSDEAKAKRIITMMNVEFKWSTLTLGSWLLSGERTTEEQVKMITDNWIAALLNPTITCA